MNLEEQLMKVGQHHRVSVLGFSSGLCSRRYISDEKQVNG